MSLKVRFPPPPQGVTITVHPTVEHVSAQAPLNLPELPKTTIHISSGHKEAVELGQQVAAMLLGCYAGLPLDGVRLSLRQHLTTIAAGTGDVAAAWRSVLANFPKDQVRRALSAITEGANEAATVEADNVIPDEGMVRGKGEERDWHRTWGLRLLNDDDPAFRDGAYLVDYLRESKATRSAVLADGVTSCGPRGAFEETLRQLVPDASVAAYTDTGSDAVSLAYSIATACGRRRAVGRGKDPEMLFFDGVYGGGRGRASSMNFYGWGAESAEKKGQFRLPSPTSTDPTFSDPTELSRIKRMEKKVLAEIENRAKRNDPPIGAVFIEIIQGANGVRYYRPEFLAELREICDRVGLPIIADEVLSCLRTGKVFSYEHYDGFFPDFVCFGKGMQCAGIAQITRRNQKRSQRLEGRELGVTTIGADPIRALKGAQMMRAIRDRNLFEQSAELGRVLVEKLRALQEIAGVTVDASGSGFLIGATSIPGSRGAVSNATGHTRDRFMPPLSLTREDIDRVYDDMLSSLVAKTKKDLARARKKKDLKAQEHLKAVLERAKLSVRVHNEPQPAAQA